MAAPFLITGVAYEDGGCSIMGRITGLDGENIVQADISTITCAVFDRSGTAAGTPAIVVADSVFDTLQTDSRWTINDVGYNFRHDVAASILATGGEEYTFEYKFTPASGEVFQVMSRVRTIGIRTS
jgi:hypothetical protein